MACHSLNIVTVEGGYSGLAKLQSMSAKVYAQESIAITAGSWKLTMTDTINNEASRQWAVGSIRKRVGKETF